MMKLLLVSLCLYFSTAALAQDCGYNVGVGSFAGNVSENPQVVAHTAVLTRTGSASDPNCSNYRVYFGKGNANSYQRQAFSGTNTLNYNLFRTVNLGNILKDFGDAGNGEFIAGTAPVRNNPYTSTFYVSIPDLNSIFATTPAGVYTDVVPIHFYQVRNNGNVEFQTTRYLTISFNLPRYAELSIVAQNAPHDATSTTYVMDFGTLEPREEIRADLNIKANVGYGVMLSSTNGGRLLGPGSTPVPYQIRVGSGGFFTPTPAGAQTTVAQSNFGTPAAGQRYNLRVRLGTFGQLDDGDYQEVITITVQAW